jgi:hypothetical protein
MAIVYNAQSQKLPGLQDKYVFLPTNARVDGKATEWNNQFSARNQNNYMSYTVANDKENIYIIIRLNDYITIGKALEGGFTFSVSNSADRKKQISAEYLMEPIKSRQIIKLARAYYQDSIKDQNEIAELPRRMTLIFNQIFKKIKVTGINNLKSDTISVYNTDGIEIASGFDKEIAMITEIKFPVKQLATLANGLAKLNYTIKLNGIPIPQKIADTPINARYNRSVDDFAAKANFYRYSPGIVSGEYVMAIK